jgi:hypothetical protein
MIDSSMQYYIILLPYLIPLLDFNANKHFLGRYCCQLMLLCLILCSGSCIIFSSRFCLFVVVIFCRYRWQLLKFRVVNIRFPVNLEKLIAGWSRNAHPSGNLIVCHCVLKVPLLDSNQNLNRP